MNTIRFLLDRSLQIFCCILFVCMVGVASWQVITRYVLNSPSTMSEALLRFLLIWLSMMAIAYVSGKRGHVSLTLLGDHLTGNLKKLLDISIEAIFIVFALTVFIYGGIQATANTMSQTYPMLQISKSLIYASLPVAGTIITIYCILNCISLYRNVAIKGVDEQ